MGKKPSKRPRVDFAIRGDKRTAVAEAGTTNDQRPTWSVARLDLDGPFGWRRLTAEQAAQVLERLRSFETMTWQAITVVAKKQHHTIPVEKLSTPARKRLTDLEMDDVDGVVSFHVDGRARIIGVRRGGVCELLWWDPDHQVCPAPKTHT